MATFEVWLETVAEKAVVVEADNLEDAMDLAYDEAGFSFSPLGAEYDMSGEWTVRYVENQDTGEQYVADEDF